MWNRYGKWSTTMVFIIVLILPMVGLLIMNDQLTTANSITSASVVNAGDGDTQIFAGILIILLVIGGLVSLFFKLRSHVKTKKHAKIADKKIEAIRASGADIVVTDCPGCQIQLTDGIIRNKMPVKVMHVMELQD